MFDNYKDLMSFLDTLPEAQDPEEQAICNYSDLIDEFSLMLVQYRMQYKLTQQELAEKLSISQTMVSQYERGARNISLSTLCDLVSKLGMKVSLTYKSLYSTQHISDHFQAESLDEESDDLGIFAA